MENKSAGGPVVRISHDQMEAYLLLPMVNFDQTYKFEEVMDLLDKNGVRFGVDKKVIDNMISNRIFGREVLVAHGEPVEDGRDGYYNFGFDCKPNKKPVIRDDGSVDYWSVHAIETVEEGQVIATYVEPVPGKNGMTVKGTPVTAQRGRPIPPLLGRGFERSEDGLTYKATISGKIEMQNNRILIVPIYEIFGDVDVNTGNIDFKGDVVIHGNIKPGASVRSTASITVDGISEGCNLEAGKDIILRGGMIGGDKAHLKVKGNLYAKFIEYTHVEADGFIEADSAMNSTIISYDKVIFAAGHASVIGGAIYGCAGIEANNFGNESEVKTEVNVGIHKKIRQRIFQLQNLIEEDQILVDKINSGIRQYDEISKEKGLNAASDEKRVALLRARIARQAEISKNSQELEWLNSIVERSQGATVKVERDVYPNVEVRINDAKVLNRHKQSKVEFIEQHGKVVMLSLLDQ